MVEPSTSMQGNSLESRLSFVEGKKYTLSMHVAKFPEILDWIGFFVKYHIYYSKY